VVDLQEDNNRNKKLLNAIIRNETKLKTELCGILNKNSKLVWTQDAHLRTCIGHFVELLSGQTEREDVTENNYTTEHNNFW
jgi:hypothetical protein